jgi:hypothetical protein
MGVLFCPRVVVQRVRLQSGAGHHRGRRALVQIGWEALPQGMELFARDPHCPREACRGLALAIPRSHSTKVAGRCRVFAKTVPVSKVESPSQARQR